MPRHVPSTLPQQPRPGLSLAVINDRIADCEQCPDLRAYCTQVGIDKRRAYREDHYWTRPVPGFGDPAARLWIVGLAPAAHGANRTGRMFTGDRSGDFLYAGLHRAGYANQSTSEHRDDGLTLRDCYISAALRCAPPANRPTNVQLLACRSWLVADFHALTKVHTILALGGIAWNAVLDLARELGTSLPSPRPRFCHGARVDLQMADRQVALVGCYHVSQQNTFTGRLTQPMLDAVLVSVRS